MKNKIFPHTFWRPFLDCMPQLFFRPKYVWFPIHLKGPMIPDPSGQLAELIVYITSTRVDLYSHQILLRVFDAVTVLCVCRYMFCHYRVCAPSASHIQNFILELFLALQHFFGPPKAIIVVMHVHVIYVSLGQDEFILGGRVLHLSKLKLSSLMQIM